MLLKGCTQYVSKFGKLSSGHRTEKGQFSFQSQRKATRQNVQITMRCLPTFLMLLRLCLKILQARLQQYMNWKIPDVKTGFRKGRESRDQIANIHYIIEKAREFQKKMSISASLTTQKTLTVWITTNWKILKEYHLTGHLSELYVGQEATARTLHGTTDCFQIEKEVRQSYILSPCLFNFYAEYIMWNAGPDESQAGIRIAERNINNPRYADNTTLMAEGKEELKSHLIKVKKEMKKLV